MPKTHYLKLTSTQRECCVLGRRHAKKHPGKCHLNLLWPNAPSSVAGSKAHVGSGRRATQSGTLASDVRASLTQASLPNTVAQQPPTVPVAQSARAATKPAAPAAKVLQQSVVSPTASKRVRSGSSSPWLPLPSPPPGLRLRTTWDGTPLDGPIQPSTPSQRGLPGPIIKWGQCCGPVPPSRDPAAALGEHPPPAARTKRRRKRRAQTAAVRRHYARLAAPEGPTSAPRLHETTSPRAAERLAKRSRVHVPAPKRQPPPVRKRLKTKLILWWPTCPRCGLRWPGCGCPRVLQPEPPCLSG